MPYLQIGQNNLFYVDVGSGVPVVFVHGTPTNSDEYSKVIENLKSNYRCVCIDHLGFGKSEKPEAGDYSIPAHTKRLRDLLLHLQLKNFHLVVHDFGGAIGLPLLFEKELKILSLTLINTWFWPLIDSEPQMKSQKVLVSSGVIPFLYKYFNFSPRVLFKIGWGKYAPFPASSHQSYMNQFPKAADRSGTIFFLKALFDFENECWKQINLLKNKINQPVLIAWGCDDKLITTKTLKRWKEVLPHAEVQEFKEVGHFVAEEAPDLLAKAIRGHFEKVQSS